MPSPKLLLITAKVWRWWSFLLKMIVSCFSCSLLVSNFEISKDSNLYRSFCTHPADNGTEIHRNCTLPKTTQGSMSLDFRP